MPARPGRRVGTLARREDKLASLTFRVQLVLLGIFCLRSGSGSLKIFPQSFRLSPTWRTPIKLFFQEKFILGRHLKSRRSNLLKYDWLGLKLNCLHRWFYHIDVNYQKSVLIRFSLELFHYTSTLWSIMGSL